MLGALVASNVVLLALGSWVSVVPMAIQVAALLALRQRWPHARTVVRVWAVTLAAGGGAALAEWAARLAVRARGGPGTSPDAVP